MANKNIQVITNSPALIVAHDRALGIGMNNKLPWHIPGDMKYFRRITCQIPGEQMGKAENVVIMGRKTWESLPQTFKPLPRRINLVLTKNSEYLLPPGVLLSESLEEALQTLEETPHARIFVIGGASIYKEAINMDVFSTLYVTEIEGQYNCDVFFPEYRNSFTLVESSPVISEGNYNYCHKTYIRNALAAK
jgi:dihydrofolate reductase